MRKIIENLLRIPIIVFDCYIKLIGLIDVRLKNKSMELFGHLIDNISKTFTHKSMSGRTIEISLYTPNSVCGFRADTFSTKEPETLVWINGFKENATFFDIGANIGLYSCYAAKKLKCNTFAFEPSFFNLELLSKNIFVNNLSSLIKIVPISLSSEFILLMFLRAD